MRILAVLQGLDHPGSAVTTCCISQLEALAQEHRCSIVSDGQPQPGRTQLSVVRLPVPKLRFLRRFAHVPRQLLFIGIAGLHLCRGGKSDRIDLVLLHSHPSTALLAPWLRRFRGCKVAMVLHGDIRDRPPGTYDPRLTWWYRITTPTAYRQADAVLATSPYMSRLAVDGGAPTESVYLVPHGVDAVDIGLTCPPAAAEGSMLLFIGRIEFNKGVDLLVEALCRLAPSRPRLRLTCIGSPDQGYLESLQRRLRAADCEHRVRFLPPQPRRELGRFYAQAALVVVPSRSEALSTVAIEAMAAGRPVLASDTGGNPLIVDAPHTGVLFANRDADALTGELKLLIDAPEQLAAMGEAARARHAATFSRRRAGETLRRQVRQIVGPDARQL
jgi:glycosyltransferase involved in cell wall biosynthesis